MEADPSFNPKCFLEFKSDDPDSAFHFVDTMSSRAGIFDLNKPFENHVISIIGLGGTGNYVLDYISKMPVAEVRLFDDDKFFVHNAFRRAGSTTEDDFGKSKVDLFSKNYGTFHKNIIPFKKRITSKDHLDVIGSDFAFVCVDHGDSRMAIARALMDNKIPFLDVGMGLSRGKNGLNGMVRTTLFNDSECTDLVATGLLPTKDAEDDIYSSNIQIAELNALNASLAVIKYKQLFGFFETENGGFHSLFDIASSSLFFRTENECDE